MAARPKKIPVEPGVVYDADELAAVIGTNRNSLNVRRHNGTIRIPVIRLGNRNFFKGSDILTYLADQTDPTGGTRPQTKRAPSPGRPPKKQAVA